MSAESVQERNIRWRTWTRHQILNKPARLCQNSLAAFKCLPAKTAHCGSWQSWHAEQENLPDFISKTQAHIRGIIYHSAAHQSHLQQHVAQIFGIWSKGNAVVVTMEHQCRYSGMEIFLSIKFFLQTSQIEPGWFRGSKLQTMML